MIKSAPSASGPADTDVFSVSRLNREARQLLETGLPLLWVAGELSNFAQPGSGHMYFTLKDAQAQVRCAMFRGANRRLSFKPADGNQVLVQARVSIYEPRGSYQLIVEQMEEAGEGLLRRRFEELKQKLDREGLFAEEHKQPLPALPRSIGVVTSPTGAALRDILHVLARRYPAAEVIIYPTRVQGNEATAEIAAAISKAGARNEVDVLLVARGGGSLEDLWCFNEEAVARAAHACALPLISGVGHEVDFTIIDLVADVRAPTPSGAAELAVPDCTELLGTLAAVDRRATASLRRLLVARSTAVQHMQNRLQRIHPGAILRQLSQRSDELARQLGNGISNYLELRRLSFAHLRQQLIANAPLDQIRGNTERNRSLHESLLHDMERRLARLQSRIALAAGNLNAVSPLATLERGYAIVRDSNSGKVITNAAQLKPGDQIEARLARGELQATVDKLKQA